MRDLFERWMMSRRRTVVALLVALVGPTFIAGCAHPASGTGPAPDGKSSSDGVPKTTTAEFFRGKFPGVDVTEVPGGIKVRIRNPGGLESFRNNADSTGSSRGGGLQGAVPLYVVDGTPVEAIDGALLIDPQTIAKIEIVDTAGLALYGIRGANGVVKVTTKRK